jgi:hypothetical protein
VQSGTESPRPAQPGLEIVAQDAVAGFGIALMRSYVQTQTAMLADSFREEVSRSLKNTPHIVLNFTPNIVQIDTVAAAIFLILEMYSPFKGLIQISSAPLCSALALLGK